MAYDSECFYLAEYFLRNNGAATAQHKSDLAQAIQDAVEDFAMPVEEYPDNGPTDPHETSGPGMAA